MATTNFTTYAQRYADPALDPFHGHYEELMAQFKAKPTREGAAVAQKLFSNMYLAADSQPHAFLYLAWPVNQDPVISVLHRPFSVAPLFGINGPTQYFAFQGDAQAGFPPSIVTVEDDIFQPLPTLRVPTAELLDTVYTDNGQDLAGPYTPADEGTEVIATRYVAYLPVAYHPLALTKPYMKPREAWQLIGGAIRQAPVTDGHTPTEDLAPLLDWLRAACTLQNPKEGEDNDYLGAVMQPALPPFPMPPAVLTKAQDILARELQGNAQPTLPETGTVLAINNLTARITQAQDEAVNRDRQAKEQTPSTYFGDSISLLCRITHATPENVPLLYFRMAQSTKRTERATLEEHLRMVAEDLALQGHIPAATPSLTK